MDNLDYDVYDERPGEDYVSGYLIATPIGVQWGRMQYMRKILSKGFIYGYIPTGYPVVEGEKIRVLVYFLFRSKFEAKVFSVLACDKHRCLKLADHLELYNNGQKVWFHKKWILEQCLPKSEVYLNAFYATRNLPYRKKHFTKSEVLKMQHARDKSCPKYTPRPGSERCVGRLRHNKICYTCSVYTDKWEENIIKYNRYQKKS